MRKIIPYIIALGFISLFAGLIFWKLPPQEENVPKATKADITSVNLTLNSAGLINIPGSSVYNCGLSNKLRWGSGRFSCIED